MTIKIFTAKGRAGACLGKHYRTEWLHHHHHHNHHQHHRHHHDLFGWWLVWAGRLVHLGSTPPVGSTSSRLGSLAPREAHGDKPAISRGGSKVAFSNLFGDHFQTTCSIASPDREEYVKPSLKIASCCAGVDVCRWLGRDGRWYKVGRVLVAR